MDCDICCNQFCAEREPKILTRCGHTVCSECIESLRRTRGRSEIECPQCRTVATTSDIVTNFAVLNFVPNNIPKALELNDVCAWHASNEIAVFCTTCSAFICQECFETSSAPHAAHMRISICDAKDLLSRERKEVLDTLGEMQFRTQRELSAETAKQQEFDAQLVRIHDQAMQHFNATVRALRNQLDSVEYQLETYRSTCQGALLESMSRQSRVDEIRKLVPRGDDLGSLDEFARHRGIYRRAICELGHSDAIVSDLEGIRLEEDINGLRSNAIPLPTLHVGDVLHADLFKLEIPRIQTRTTHSSSSSRGEIHRSTSNDRLCS
jgi:hypothetical protein